MCARKGATALGTAFLPVDHEEIADDLERHGFRRSGRERMYSGITGECLGEAVFFGPMFEQRLQKFVLDDEYAVAGGGPTDAITGQPLGGKNARGGLRIGEMEQWCISINGNMFEMFKKFFTDSGGRIAHICRTCGHPAVSNERYRVYSCRTCGEAADICPITTTKAAIVFGQELAAANIRCRVGLRPRAFECRVDERDRLPSVYGPEAEKRQPTTGGKPAADKTPAAPLPELAQPLVDMFAGDGDAGVDADPNDYVPDEFDPSDMYD